MSYEDDTFSSTISCDEETNDAKQFWFKGRVKEKLKLKRKKMPKITWKARNLLQLVFNEFNYPTKKMKRLLSKETGLRREVVNMWLSNR